MKSTIRSPPELCHFCDMVHTWRRLTGHHGGRAMSEGHGIACPRQPPGARATREEADACPCTPLPRITTNAVVMIPQVDAKTLSDSRGAGHWVGDISDG